MAKSSHKAGKLAVLQLLFFATITFSYSVGDATPANAGGAVAYIEQVVPAEKKLVEVANIKRNSADGVVPENSVDLFPGDQIFMKGPGTALKVRLLASNTVIFVRKEAHAPNVSDLTVQPSLPGLSGGALAWFKSVAAKADAIVGEPDQSGGQAARAYSRGIDNTGICFNTSGKTNDPNLFQIPALFSDTSAITAGNRELVVSWQGGAPPYSVSLTDANTGEILARVQDIHDVCAIRLPRVAIGKGRFRLTLTDSNNVSDEEDNLFAVEDSPRMPAELSAAPISDEARKLYFATWLTTLDGGKWTFEAQQLVADMGCRSTSVRDWLRRWGDTSECY